MVIGLVATLKVQKGKCEVFEKLFTQLQDAVNEKESGCNFYALHRSRTDAQTYRVLEQYASEEDHVAHGKSDHVQSMMADLGRCLAGTPDVEFLDAI